MLDLRAITQQLTQGQPVAERVVAQRGGSAGDGGAGEGVAASESAGAAAAPAVAPPGIDPQAVARRVYELMRQDLAVERARRGLRR